MKKTSLIILLLSTSFFTLFAQNTKVTSKKKKTSKTNTIDHWEKNYKVEFSDCGFTNKYTAQQRLAKYPFSKSAKVLAVSYKYRGMDIQLLTNTKHIYRYLSTQLYTFIKRKSLTISTILMI